MCKSAMGRYRIEWIKSTIQHAKYWSTTQRIDQITINRTRKGVGLWEMGFVVIIEKLVSSYRDIKSTDQIEMEM